MMSFFGNSILELGKIKGWEVKKNKTPLGKGALNFVSSVDYFVVCCLNSLTLNNIASAFGFRSFYFCQLKSVLNTKILGPGTTAL